VGGESVGRQLYVQVSRQVEGLFVELLHNERAAIEFNVGRAEEPGNTLMVHVYDGQEPLSEIARLYRQHGWVAYDLAGEQFIGHGQAARESFAEWEQYRAPVISQKQRDEGPGEPV
jgi:hypothetical protein